MASISSNYAICGTYGHLVVYQVGDQLYARTKSALDGKRFREDPAFAKSREKAAQFGRASRMAKAVYATLPKEVKKRGLFGKLTAIVAKGLQEGKTKEGLLKELALRFDWVITGVSRKKEKRTSALLNYKQSPPLSQWQVSVKGLLEFAIPLTFPFTQLNYTKTAVLHLPDG